MQEFAEGAWHFASGSFATLLGIFCVFIGIIFAKMAWQELTR